MAKLVMIDDRETMAKIVEEVRKIDRQLRFGYYTGEYFDFPHIKDEDILDLTGYSIIEASQTDTRKRLPILNLPLGKQPKSHILVTIGVTSKLDDNLENMYIIHIKEYVSPRDKFAYTLAKNLVNRGLNVILTTEHYERFARYFDD